MLANDCDIHIALQVRICGYLLQHAQAYKMRSVSIDICKEASRYLDVVFIEVLGCIEALLF